MELRAEHYYRAGMERMFQARLLYDAGNAFALPMYAAGLARECILRAFRWQKDPSFEGRHDLLKLFKDGGLLTIDDARMHSRGVSHEEILRYAMELRGAMNSVAELWNNNYRFASENRVRAYLKQTHRQGRVKGDVLKANALKLLTAAQRVVDKGVSLWTSARK